MSVLHIPQIISNFDNTQGLIKFYLKKDDYFYQLHANGIVSFDLDFKMQLGNRLFALFMISQYVSYW